MGKYQGKTGVLCRFDPCENNVWSKNLCNGHYQQVNKGLELKPLVPQWPRGANSCRIEGCQSKPKARELCDLHYRRLLRKGDVGPIGYFESKWTKDDKGYIRRSGKRFGKGVIFQHREVIERHLGRKLLPHENVHHKNGQRDDNRIDNLEVWNTSQPSGQRIEEKFAWMVEYLDGYGYNVVKRG